MKIYHFIVAFIFLIHAGISTADDTDIVDMCSYPELPKEIQKIQGDLEKIITTTPSDDEFRAQWDKYNSEKEKFNTKYQDEIEKVRMEWDEIKKSLNPSELRFAITTSKGTLNEPLLDDVKSACWVQVMNTDELEEYYKCNTLKKKPTKSDWNNILTCTFEKANLLNIELY